MLEFPMVTRVGAASPDHDAVYTTGLVPVQIEVQTDDGPALLNLSQAAAADLVERLETYLRFRGSPKLLPTLCYPFGRPVPPKVCAALGEQFPRMSVAYVALFSRLFSMAVIGYRRLRATWTRHACGQLLSRKRIGRCDCQPSLAAGALRLFRHSQCTVRQRAVYRLTHSAPSG
jgi:hypothetical protein